MITVKVSSFGGSSSQNWQQFIGDRSNSLHGCQFRVNDACKEADVWFVIEQPVPGDQECLVPPERVFFATAEASLPIGYYAESARRMAFLKQFAGVFTCHDVPLPKVHYTIPLLPWMVNANHGPSISASHERDVTMLSQMHTVPKSRDLSIICSDAWWTPEHRLRLRFAHAAKEHFGERIDWFGNGINPIAEKWDGLAPYKYSIVLENKSSPNVVTEKIQDAFIALTYPLYWGAPNISDFFPLGAFSVLDIKDISGAIDRVEHVLSEDPYETALPQLRTARHIALKDLNFVARLARYAGDAVATTPHVRPQWVRLSAMTEVPLDARSRVRHEIGRAGRLAQRIGERMQRLA